MSKSSKRRRRKERQKRRTKKCGGPLAVDAARRLAATNKVEEYSRFEPIGDTFNVHGSTLLEKWSGRILAALEVFGLDDPFKK